VKGSALRDLNQLPLDALLAELGKGGLVRRLLELCRDEDLGGPLVFGFGGASTHEPWLGDVTAFATLADDSVIRAELRARKPTVVAGLALLPELIEVFAPDIAATPAFADGEAAEAGQTLSVLEGPGRQVVAVERTMLNLLARLCGVASAARRYASLVSHTGAHVYDTRKTTPGLRVLEKYAVRCGGGRCHRIGLHDALLIKDNHIAHVSKDQLASFVSAAVERAHEWSKQRGITLAFCECEVDRLDQLETILGVGRGCGLDVMLLDNMPPDVLREAVAMRDRAMSDGRLRKPLELEASGGVREDTIAAIAKTGVERISVGAITHSAISADLGLDVVC